MTEKEYWKERDTLTKISLDIDNRFHSALLTISSGSIGLSIVFLEKIDHRQCLYILFLSWVCWLISILLQLFSSLVSSRAIREEQEILNSRYEDQISGRSNRYLGHYTTIRNISFAIFFVGVVLFFAFILINLNNI